MAFLPYGVWGKVSIKNPPTIFVHAATLGFKGICNLMKIGKIN